MEAELHPIPGNDVESDLEQALWKARKLLPRKVKLACFDPYETASAVVERPESCGIACYRKPPIPLHDNPRGPPDSRAKESEAID